MIIIINGSFGIGKSTVAEMLVNMISHSLLFDAEEVGYMLHKVYKPIDNPDDFQDVPIWRELTVKTAELLRKQYQRALIMPLCLWNEAYFDEIVPGLKRFETHVYHFCLIADAETIVQRQSQRNDPPEVTEWIHNRIEKCIRAHRSAIFEKKIRTDNKSAVEVAEYILSQIPQDALDKHEND